MGFTAISPLLSSPSSLLGYLTESGSVIQEDFVTLSVRRKILLFLFLLCLAVPRCRTSTPKRLRSSSCFVVILATCSLACLVDLSHVIGRRQQHAAHDDGITYHGDAQNTTLDETTYFALGQLLSHEHTHCVQRILLFMSNSPPDIRKRRRAIRSDTRSFPTHCPTASTPSWVFLFWSESHRDFISGAPGENVRSWNRTWNLARVSRAL